MNRKKRVFLIAYILIMGIIIYLVGNEENSVNIVAIVLSIFLIIRNVFEHKNYKNLYKIAERNGRRYKMVVDSLDGGIWEWDSQSKLLYVSNKINVILCEKEKIDSFEKLFTFIPEDEVEDIRVFYNHTCENKSLEEFTIEHNINSLDGKRKIVEIHGKGKIKDNIYYLSGILKDITKKREDELIIQEQERRHRQVVEGSRDIIYYWNMKTNDIIFDNKITKYIEHTNIDTEVNISYNEWKDYILEEDIQEYNKSIENILSLKEECYFEMEYRILTKDNRIVWFQSKGKKYLENRDREYIYGTLCDITDRKEKEIKINYMSFYDEITGIANRRYFTNEIENLIKTTNEKVAFIFIDLDNFKYVNDTYGHDVGDMVLIKFSDAVNKLLDETSLFARFGGDEFIIAKTGIDAIDEIRELVESIIDAFGGPIKINEKEIYCTLSIGISIYPFDGSEVNTLLKRADMAMYVAKNNGKNRYEFFSMKILELLNREFQIEKGLRTAVSNKEIKLLYQPKYCINTEKIIGYECLVRWHSNEMGIISPGEFIPISETSGLIVDIGKHIIRKAFEQCKELSLKTDKEFKIAINLSDVQIRDEDIVQFVANNLKEFDLNPKYIEFEITESIIMKSATKNIKTLKRLKELGVTLALDDFGTGYSSLNYLRILPIDVLKIDKSFIDGINIDNRSEYIIESIIELSHYLNLIVVAEGVETEEQLSYLKKIDCDIIQGYYFSKPKEFNIASEMIIN